MSLGTNVEHEINRSEPSFIGVLIPVLVLIVLPVLYVDLFRLDPVGPFFLFYFAVGLICALTSFAAKHNWSAKYVQLEWSYE